MRVLIISKEAWRDEQNGGNVLTNLFSPFSDVEFAQIYCNEQDPNNNVCKNYYQMTDKMMVNNIFYKQKVGREIIYEDYPTETVARKESYRIKNTKCIGDLIRAVRELVWALGQWDKNEIITFARRFDPDIIFAPCYGNHYMQRLTSIVHNAINVPVVSYISDDFYTNRQFKLSPIFWLNHLLLRPRTRRTFRHYSLCYTMTDEQKEQCEEDFGANMKILRKSGRFEDRYLKQTVNTPIRIVYAGGIYLNRWRTLVALVNAMRSINIDGVKLVLDIYTNSELNSKLCKVLNDGIISRVHKVIPMSELVEVYRNSDIALHAEAFDLKNSSIVRMSFSTKIVDCLDSGCAVMAICDKKQAGGAYLRRNDCAICIDDLSALEPTLRELVDKPQILINYQHKAFDLGRKNHLQKNISKDLRDDFEALMKNRNNERMYYREK